jgi:hypothetical protein
VRSRSILVCKVLLHRLHSEPVLCQDLMHFRQINVAQSSTVICSLGILHCQSLWTERLHNTQELLHSSFEHDGIGRVHLEFLGYFLYRPLVVTPQ